MKTTTFMDGFEQLQESEKINEETASKLKERVEERQDKLSDFNDNKREELRKKVDEESQKTIDMIDKKSEESNE